MPIISVCYSHLAAIKRPMRREHMINNLRQVIKQLPGKSPDFHWFVHW